jgi:phosphonate transport system ATP-binding protein
MAGLTIRNIEKRFNNGFHALKGVNVEVAAGSFTVVLGPSGAGKSTLLRLMNGLESATRGDVAVDGVAVTAGNLRAIRGNVAMVFQHFNLVGRLSVMTNVLVGRLKTRSWLGSVLYLFKREDMDIAHEALDRVGLVEKSWERADRLSGGQQQRVGIARALAQKPRIILADEPVASLDPVNSEEIMQLLRGICDCDAITVLVNLHQVDLAKRFADRIIGLNAGRVVFDGTPAELDREKLARIYRREGVEHDEQLESVLAYA